ncbi:signal recognition particle subunit SRP72-like [Mytilus galloprovincialis]|uniref:signal recognition particle subunit SRP72-like n=1 Tax=Mytilus galloprovincialis TaxID=29158 RepID=UPI003F7C68CD
MAKATVLQNLYAELNKYKNNQEYDRALKIVNKILQEDSTDATAFHCKIVCLIKEDKFDQALTSINKAKDLSSGLHFEKAYCQYRLNRTKEALTTLRSVDKPDTRVKELLSQVLYRLEQYEECYNLYRDIIKSTEDDFEEERQTNLSAVVSSLQLWDKKDVGNPEFDESSYEICYNNACYFIGKEDWTNAEKKLRKAEIFCKKSFEDESDVTEEEIEEELGIIRVQLAYVLQKQGRKDEAVKLNNQVTKNKPSDMAVMAVLSNNIITLNKDQNVFDSKKRMKTAKADGLKHKLTAAQQRCISLNEGLLHMYTNQSNQCHNLAQKLMKEYPDIDTPVLIEAAQYVKDKDTTKAIDVLKAYEQSHQSRSVSIKMVMAQIYLSQGHVYDACDTLKTMGDLQYKPGVVSAMVTLYLGQEDREQASKVLTQAITWYKKNQSSSACMSTLMRANTTLQIQMGNPQQAAAMLEELRKSNPKDPRILAELISAYSQFDQAKAQKISADLPPVEDIVQGIDVETLEASFSSLGPKYIKKALKSDAQPSPGPAGDMIVQKSKSKKKKKGKLPKNLDAEIDPERWLPRRERSYYRGKKKDKRRDIGKGTQGASGPAGDIDNSKLTTGGGSGSEASSPRPGQPTSPPGSGQPTAQGPRQQKPAQANKKKKKKGGGGKW